MKGVYVSGRRVPAHLLHVGHVCLVVPVLRRGQVGLRELGPGVMEEVGARRRISAAGGQRGCSRAGLPACSGG